MLHHAAGFFRRVVLPMSRYPFRMFKLVKMPNHVICEERNEVTREILYTPDEDLEINARKTKRTHRLDLEHVLLSGAVGTCLHAK